MCVAEIRVVYYYIIISLSIDLENVYWRRSLELIQKRRELLGRYMQGIDNAIWSEVLTKKGFFDVRFVSKDRFSKSAATSADSSSSIGRFNNIGASGLFSTAKR